MGKAIKEVFIGLRIPGTLAKDLDDEVKISLEFLNRSDLIRQVLTEYVAGMGDLRRK